MPGAFAARRSLVFCVSASRPSIGLAAGVTDSFASTLAGFVADSGGGWKFTAQPINHCAQNTLAKIPMLVFMPI